MRRRVGRPPPRRCRRRRRGPAAMGRPGGGAGGGGRGGGRAWAVEVSGVRVGCASGTATIDMSAKREAWASLDALLAHAVADTVVVSETAVPLLERRFEVAPLDVGK